MQGFTLLHSEAETVLPNEPNGSPNSPPPVTRGQRRRDFRIRRRHHGSKCYKRRERKDPSWDPDTLRGRRLTIVGSGLYGLYLDEITDGSPS